MTGSLVAFLKSAAAPLDLAGVGIGPANLSLAALLDGIDDLRVHFFDRRPSFDWHPGMMLPNVELQSPFLRDLVTSVQPTSPWSFVSYLVEHRRLFAFLNAQYEAVPRQEMANYFAWVASQLSTLSFGSEVREITFDGTLFQLELGNGVVQSRNIVIGTGRQPVTPPWAGNLLGERCFHSAESRWRLDDLADRRVVVVGGGQSGGEVVDYLLSLKTPPSNLKWLSRRHNFEPINDTPFSNQIYSPEYIEAYRRLTDEKKAVALQNSVLAADGLSLSTIGSIYRKLYRIRYIDRLPAEMTMLPGRNVVQADQHRGEFRLVVHNGFDDSTENFFADAIVLATGYRFALPDAVAPLSERIAHDRQGNAILSQNYALQWDGPNHAQIFAQNAGRFSHGIADSQLSLIAWRSATIANALLGRAHFDLTLPDPVLTWLAMPEAVPKLEVATIDHLRV